MLALTQDPDELTRTIACAVQAGRAGSGGMLAFSSQIADHDATVTPIEIALQIKVVPIFARLTTRQLMDLAGVVREETYPPGATVFNDGDDGTAMYLVVEGEVQVSKAGKILTEIGPRGFFGEISLFEGVARSASVTTAGGARLLRCERDDLMALIDESPDIAIGICRSLSHRLRDVTSG
jgi:CRP-like cAMP-binding protein